MKTTIVDVARETGLALSTISKFLNGGNVRKDNREKIERAIKKLDYVPNGYAQNLRKARTNTIGCLIHSMQDEYATQLVMYLTDAAIEKHYQLLYACHNGSPEAADNAIRLMIESGVDGIILEPVEGADKSLELMRYQEIPFVAIDKKPPVGACDCVMTNGFLGGYMGCEELIKFGHRKIAIITADNAKDRSSWNQSRERTEGFLRALKDYDITIPDNYVENGNYLFQSGSDCMEKLWAVGDHPTALFIANYDMCLGAMLTIHELNIKVPEELSVVTFDDLLYSCIASPELTAVKQDTKKMAYDAVDMIIRRIIKERESGTVIVREMPELISRDSVRNILLEKETDPK